MGRRRARPRPPGTRAAAPARLQPERAIGAGAGAALTPAARRANVAGAFEVRNAECGVWNNDTLGNSAFRTPHSALVLVDDVFTTGSTLAEAARALERAGVITVLAVTFGRAVLP